MLRRFSAYLEKRLGFRQLVSGLHDARLLPQIPTLNVWLSVFGMYVLRPGSFNALEQELRVGKRWDARLIDVISADPLCLEAPFFRLVLDAGKHLVVVMKQERRDLYQDAERLRSLVKPQILVDGPRTTRLWDIPDLPSFTTLDRPVRVVWVEEETLKRKVLEGRSPPHYPRRRLLKPPTAASPSGLRKKMPSIGWKRAGSTDGANAPLTAAGSRHEPKQRPSSCGALVRMVRRAERKTRTPIMEAGG